MPIYEYQCSSCGHQMEAFQKISDAPLTECPNCHKAALQKLISAAGFQLKGTGWYATDYKDKSKTKPKGKEEDGTKGSGGKETKTSEAKTSDSKSDSSSGSSSSSNSSTAE